MEIAQASASVEDSGPVFFPLLVTPAANPSPTRSLLLISSSELPSDDCSALASVRAGLEACVGPIKYLWTADAGGADISSSSVALAPAARKAWLRWADNTLWPALHARPPGDPDGTERAGVAAMNAAVQALAAAVVSAAAAADTNFVAIVGHELLALPAAIRSLWAARGSSTPQPSLLLILPTAFAAAESFRTLPPRSDLLAGALGSDAIAVPDAEWARQLSNAAVNALGVDASPLRVAAPGGAALRRFVALVVNPLGILPAAWESGEVQTGADADAESARVWLEASLRARHGRVASALSVSIPISLSLPSPPPLPLARPLLVASLCDDDDTAALPSRVAAIEIFFSRYVSWRGRVTFILFVRAPQQHNTPGNEARAARRSVVDEACGRVCGRLTTPSWEPLLLLRSRPARADIRALFASAAVGLFTSAVSGAATEAYAFVAAHAHAAAANAHTTSAGSQTPPDAVTPTALAPAPGVLIIGPAVGSACLLQGALVASPTDPAAVADAVATALNMGTRERWRRHAQLLAAVRFFNARAWAERALDVTAASASAARAAAAAAASPAPAPAAAAQTWRSGGIGTPRILVLSMAALRGAAVTPRAGAALARLRAAGVGIVVVSSRDGVRARAAASAALAAGAELAASRGAEWIGWSDADVAAPWYTSVRELMDEFTARTPGAAVAGGGAGGLEWRCDKVGDAALGAARARDLLLALRAGDIESSGADATLDPRRARVIVRTAGLGAISLIARIREAAAEGAGAGGARVLAIVGAIVSAVAATAPLSKAGETTAEEGGEVAPVVVVALEGEGEGECDTADDDAGDDDDEVRRAADVGVALAGGAAAVEEYLEALAVAEIIS